MDPPVSSRRFPKPSRRQNEHDSEMEGLPDPRRAGACAEALGAAVEAKVAAGRRPGSSDPCVGHFAQVTSVSLRVGVLLERGPRVDSCFDTRCCQTVDHRRCAGDGDCVSIRLAIESAAVHS